MVWIARHGYAGCGARGVRLVALSILALLAGLVAGPARGAASTPVPETFFGVSPVLTTIAPGDMERMGAAEVGTFRFQLSWLRAQREQGGPYDWRTSDALVTEAVTNGMQPLPFLFGSPAWAAPTPTTAPLASEAARQGYLEFAQAAAARYGNDGSFWAEHPELTYMPVTAWEIWNEPNLAKFWGGQRASPGDYAELLALGHDGVKAGDPNGIVMVGGLNGQGAASMSMMDFVRELYAVPGAAADFDAVGIHPYAGSPQDSMWMTRRVREILDNRGQEAKTLYITELGWASGPHSQGKLYAPPLRQAKKMRTAFRLYAGHANGLELETLIWFTWKNEAGGVCGWCGKAGLVDSTGETKRAGNIFAHFAGGDL